MLDSIGVYPDGLDFDGYVAGVPRLHPACEFKFRPMLAEEVRALSSAISRQDAQTAQVTIANEVGARITKWNLQGGGGAVVPPSPEAFRRICPELSEKLCGVIQGYRPSDVKPSGEQLQDGIEQLRESEKN
jgi:hypothetical protein